MGEAGAGQSICGTQTIIIDQKRCNEAFFLARSVFELQKPIRLRQKRKKLAKTIVHSKTVVIIIILKIIRL